MATDKIRFEYTGSIGWLIFWIIAFFPVALVLMFTSGKLRMNEKTYYVRYEGSQCWLAFWVVVFFPIAFLLLFLKGVSLISDQS